MVSTRATGQIMLGVRNLGRGAPRRAVLFDGVEISRDDSVLHYSAYGPSDIFGHRLRLGGTEGDESVWHDEWSGLLWMTMELFVYNKAMDHIHSEELTKSHVSDASGFHSRGEPGLFKIMRLAARLGIPIGPRRLDQTNIGSITQIYYRVYDPFTTRFTKFVNDVMSDDLKVIMEAPFFNSLFDGTVYRNSYMREWMRDSRLSHVKRFLMKHSTDPTALIRAQPSDKQVDTFIYMFLGSELFQIQNLDPDDPQMIYDYLYSDYLFWGLQDLFYDQNGRHVFRDRVHENPDGKFFTYHVDSAIVSDSNLNRDQLPIQGLYYNLSESPGPIWGGPGTFYQNIPWELRIPGERMWGIREDANSNSNMNSNGYGAAASYDGSNQANRNAERDNSNNSNRIIWEERKVQNLPSDNISGDNFQDGSRAINLGHDKYLTPATFRTFARSSMIDVYNLHGNSVLFTNPFTRQDVRRSDIRFVTLRKQS